MQKRGWITAAILTLLVIDQFLYAATGRLSEVVDGVGWLVLFVLFVWEEWRGGKWSPRVREQVRWLRALAAIAVVWAAFAYVAEGAWSDAANAWLWLGVVVLLEVEMRRPQWVAERPEVFKAAAAGMFGGLAALVSVWLWEGEWLDAFDAALWLFAFLFVELNLLRPRTPATEAP
ncbi:MAG: hypothetical protein N2557_01040 [Hydrogenophilus sp.]|nr:hypothetical protein [Hydrogenophilus sp.]